MAKAKTVRVEDIKQDFFVRKALDDDYVLTLAALYEAGTKLPPLVVTPDMVLVDGRHRLEALKFLGIEEVEVEVREYANKMEMIMDACTANMGGSKPPGSSDLEHTCELLLAENVSRRQIIKLFDGTFPAEALRKILDDIQSKIAKRKANEAAAAVREGGLNVVQAAEKYEVNPETIKALLGGRKDSKGRKKTDPLAADLRALTARSRGFGVSNANLFKKLIKLYADGLITEKKAREVFSDFNDTVKRSAAVGRDWQKRLEEEIAKRKNEK